MEDEAARVYDKRAKELHVNRALNFLPDGSLNPDRKQRRCVNDSMRKDPSAQRALPPKCHQPNICTT